MCDLCQGINNESAMCMSQKDEFGYYCTRPVGHVGNHIACFGGDSDILETWEGDIPKEILFRKFRLD